MHKLINVTVPSAAVDRLLAGGIVRLEGVNDGAVICGAHALDDWPFEGPPQHPLSLDLMTVEGGGTTKTFELLFLRFDVAAHVPAWMQCIGPVRWTEHRVGVHYGQNGRVVTGYLFVGVAVS